MGAFRSVTKQSPGVQCETIANVLPVNEEFTLQQFHELTGIKYGSASARLLVLVRDGYIGRDDSRVDTKYWMTQEMKEGLISVTAKRRAAQAKAKFKVRAKRRSKATAAENNYFERTFFDKILFSMAIL